MTNATFILFIGSLDMTKEIELVLQTTMCIVVTLFHEYLF